LVGSSKGKEGGKINSCQATAYVALGRFRFPCQELDLDVAFEKAKCAGLPCDLQDYNPPYLLRIHYKSLKVAIAHTGAGTFSFKPGVTEIEWVKELSELFDVLNGK
jgi:hypothetical protein